MKVLFYAAAGLLLLTACGTESSIAHLYNWQNYESATYAYYKQQTPESEKQLLDMYKALIDSPGGLRKQVPPGVHAEYGYLLWRGGKQEEGMQLMKMEQQLYPESKPFIDRLMKQMEK